MFEHLIPTSGAASGGCGSLRKWGLSGGSKSPVVDWEDYFLSVVHPSLTSQCDIPAAVPPCCSGQCSQTVRQDKLSFLQFILTGILSE